MMGSFYQKYLRNKERELKNVGSKYDKVASNQVRKLAPELQRSRTKIEETLRRDDASPLAKARFQQEAEDRYIDMTGNIYSKAEMMKLAEEERLTGEREQLQVKADIEKHQNKMEDKSRTAQIWKTAGEVVAGAGTFALTGGNLPAAMGASRAAGGIVDTAVGLDKTYESPELIAQGMGNVISGVLSVPRAISQEKLLTGMQEALPTLSQMEPEDLETIYTNFMIAQEGGVSSANIFNERLARALSNWQANKTFLWE